MSMASAPSSSVIRWRMPFRKIVDRESARRALGLDSAASVVALLPGSRRGEVARLAADFAATARWLAGTAAGA